MQTFTKLAVATLVIIAGLYGAWKWHSTHPHGFRQTAHP